MLDELVVQGLGPIERAELSLSGGSTALTGETGAGKTLLVAAVGLLLGGRTDRQMIREASDQAWVEGRFLLPADHGAVRALLAQGFLSEESARAEPVELVVARTLTRSVSKARVNGRLAPVGLLAQLAPALVEIAGQHEYQRLSSRAFQRWVLDAFAGEEALGLADRVSTSVRAAAAARRRLQELRSGERERERELDVLRYEIAEIEKARLEPGEMQALSAEAARLEHAEAIATRIGAAIDALRGEGGAEERLGAALSSVSAVSDKDPVLDELATRLEATSYELADIAQELHARVPDPDPNALESVRDRLGTIGRLRRKYGEDEAEIRAYLDRARSRADELGSTADDAQEAERDRERHEAEALDATARLGALRREAVPRLAAAVTDHLAELAMAEATFEVSLEPCDLYEGGSEKVELLVATGRGETPRPVAKIASGGELSRLSLSLHLLVADDSAPTMIFDEVDSGVGGEAAQAVGRALARLARAARAQVLVVTHLPQVAAFADDHFRVARTEGRRRGVAVEKVEGEDRVAELSRMLAGMPRSERAREHAQELLELAAARS